jgi:hypothetical protein
MYLLSMPELLSLSGNLLPLYVESVKELLALLIVKAGEKKAYLKQESELTVVSGVECGCLGGILRGNVARFGRAKSARTISRERKMFVE